MDPLLGLSPLPFLLASSPIDCLLVLRSLEFTTSPQWLANTEMVRRTKVGNHYNNGEPSNCIESNQVLFL